MAYKGSDLDPKFVEWFKKEKQRIIKILKAKGCTDIKLDYGFYYFSGFFTSKSGQIYYISCSDVRHFPGSSYLYRTAESYKDFIGDSNQYVNPNELNKIKLI